MDVESRAGDVLTPSTLRGVADGCDAVIHAAGRPGFGALDRDRQRRVTVDGTAAMLHEAASAGCTAFVLAGYAGTVQERGGQEAGEAVDELTPPGAAYESPYVRMKMESEAITLESNRPGTFRAMVVSPGALFGGKPRSLLTGLALLYLRRELPFRLLDDAWIAVSGPRDVGSCLIGALARGRGGHRYFATGECLRLGQLFARLQARSGVPVPRRRLPDLLVEELGVLAPVLPPNSFLRDVVLPREFVLHVKRLAPLRNERTRRELGFVPESLDTLIDDVVRESGLLPGHGAAGTAG
jgi:dihydroflavonol-4-reductase